VLGSGNVDEARLISFIHSKERTRTIELTNVQILRGYYTKYDASSADISPLGSISKIDIKRFQRWAKDKWDLPILKVCVDQSPAFCG
jgi:hypothetical protein